MELNIFGAVHKSRNNFVAVHYSLNSSAIPIFSVSTYADCQSEIANTGNDQVIDVAFLKFVKLCSVIIHYQLKYF